MNPPQLSFAWWNTSFKAPVISVNKINHKALLRAWFLFCHLDDLLNLDFIAFGEVNNDFMAQIDPMLTHSGFKGIDASGRDGRITNDIGIFYKTETLELIDHESIIKPHYSGRLKIATLFRFNIKATVEPIYFFVAHWPSKLSRPELGRDELGIALRDYIDEIFEEEGYNAKIIIIGDFNNEPFEEPIYDKLRATRDRKLLLTKPFFLYNPFWRTLGGPAPYCGRSEVSPCHGTYYLKTSQHVTKWFTFDQIIVSSAFLGHGDWHLAEGLTTVLSYDNSSILGAEFFKDHDHLPIYGKVEKYEQNT
ncbi:hypothetical protein EA797_04400 [Stutzerimonas zhaodongensis]|uniref:Endonuclease/exonuclease/phosphatase domain-containing protein n=1 Tax=Stutzerimonas zhaodongensis TaxID=1176257 RepID=A0A3M2HX41_9GAMM|nr:hypothetical protein [Stutzerimonas zhaodongensis]MCQ4314460.1 hypothetical protein [Stutzerimonas zhaodongensis]RMH91979.1 hypothetical protein EA797_04400 [Stutzerimonas zhaodongensis]